jgi:hypothetical protein
MKNTAMHCALLLFGLSLTKVNAQQAVPASGGVASGVGGSATYTVGQAIYITAKGANGSVAQGVQHPFEISISGLNEVTDINLNLLVYPNPVTDAVILTMGQYDFNNLSYQLSDITGKYLANKKINNSETTILMRDLPQGTYLLTVSNPNNKLKAFKIVKNQ